MKDQPSVTMEQANLYLKEKDKNENLNFHSNNSAQFQNLIINQEEVKNQNYPQEILFQQNEILQSSKLKDSNVFDGNSLPKKLYTCDICHKVYNRSIRLKVHKRTHVFS